MKTAIIYSQNHEQHIMLNRVANSLVEADVEVSVIDCAPDFNEAPQKTHQHFPVRYWKGNLLNRVIWPVVRRIPSLRLHDRYWRSILTLRIKINALRLGWASARTRPDRYLACDLTAAAAALCASKLFAAPIVYLAYEIESEQGFGDSVRVQRSVLRARESFLLPRIDQLVTPNQARADFYQRHHRLRNNPIVVRNCSPWYDVPRNKQLHARLGLADSTRIVLYHGAFIPYRALENLIRSTAFFDQDIVLVMIGRQNDYCETSLLPLCDADGMKGRVYFLPFVPHPEIMTCVASADLGVVIYENLNLNNYLCAPTKLYEYVMLGLPVIANNYPEPRSVVDEFGIGIIVDSTDPDAIGAAVNKYFAGTPGNRSFTYGALVRARDALNWERESEKLLAVLTKQVRK